MNLSTGTIEGPTCTVVPQTSKPALQRRFTTKGAGALFVSLPLEVVRMIVIAAATDNIIYHQRWVALSLCLVCREFGSAVEPILVATVRVTERNAHMFWQQKERFRSTRSLIIDGHHAVWVNPAHFSHISFISFKVPHLLRLGEEAALYPDFHLNFRPRILRLVASDFGIWWNGLERLTSLTHVHIQQCWTRDFAKFPSYLSPSTRFLAIDPAFEEGLASEVERFLDAISRTLQFSIKVLGRVLVRTPYVKPDLRDSLSQSMTELAILKSEPRLWLDDSIAYIRSVRGFPMQDLADELDCETLYFSGRQLWSPS